MGKQSKNKTSQNLSVQFLSVQNCDAREEFRLPSELKELVEKECNKIGITKAAFYKQLAIYYFSKKKIISGTVEKIEPKKWTGKIEDMPLDPRDM